MNSEQRIRALGLTALLLAVSSAFASGKPEVRVTTLQGSAATPGISVEASDSDGLDSLDITCREIDQSYHTQLSHAAADRRFRRSFTLPELFPSAREWKYPVRLEITVRNIRGETASVVTLVQLNHPEKGK
jgi:hypothetical protein